MEKKKKEKKKRTKKKFNMVKSLPIKGTDDMMSRASPRCLSSPLFSSEDMIVKLLDQIAGVCSFVAMGKKKKKKKKTSFGRIDQRKTGNNDDI